MTIIESLQTSFETDHITEEKSDAVCPYTDADNAQVIMEPDGYVRKSEVQEIYMAVDYKKRMIRRILFVVFIIAVFIAVFWGFWKIGVIKI